MERIGSLLYPTPMSNANLSADLLDFNIRESSFHSHLPQPSIIFNGGMAYQTPKLHSSNTPIPAANECGVTTKKSIQKYVERKRRKDMKALYSLLTSLLPEEYVMGRRSTAEQLSETSNYIKSLQKKVKELTQQRDKMRKEKLCETMPFSASSQTFPAVDIHSVGSGVLISASGFKCQIVYSDLLATLQNNGLDILSASSTAVNDKVFYTIHVQVSDVESFESKNLYSKIWNLISQNRSDTEQAKS